MQMATDEKSPDDIFFNLPPDPEEAYVIYHAIETEKLSNWQDSSNNSWWGERNFVDAILAFDDVYNLAVFSIFGEPPTEDRDFADYYFKFKRASDRYSLKVKLEVARRRTTNDLAIAILEESTKKAIRQLIEAIREHLHSAPISDSKRSELFRRLDAFAMEVDQKLSRTEAFFDFAVQATKAFREVGAELQPLTDRIDRILDMVEKAQKWVEKLPPWKERKKIEPPPKQIAPPTTEDDDIPF
jgi:hypothetical protein